MTRSSAVRAAAFAAAAMLAAVPAVAGAPLRAGQPAPPFALRGVDGKMVRMDAYKGKPVYVDFFASWCAPCRDETPSIVKLASSYGPRGLVVIGVNDLEGKDKTEAFRDEFKIKYPVAIGDQKTIDAYGVIALPVHVFVDRKGFVKLYRLGEMSPSEIEAAIKSIL